MDNHNHRNSKTTKDEASKLLQFIYGTEYIFINYLLTRPSFVVLILWVLIVTLSAVRANGVYIPQSFFSNSRNFLNQYFVKMGWGWTLTITGSYALLTAIVHGCDNWKKSVAMVLFRFGAATITWYFWTVKIFLNVEDITGVCLNAHKKPNFNITSKLECVQLKNGHRWDAFDISGHCFILSFCILLTTSEIQIQKHWSKIQTHSAQFLPIGSKSLNRLKNKFRVTLPFISILFILNFMMIGLWLVMLISTCLYFHTFLSTTLGGSIGIMSWMVLYNELYRHKYVPGLPGQGTLGPVFIKPCNKNS